jgi:excisionase family DNA binding protein
MKREEPLESYLTVPEAAQLLRMAAGTLYNWIYRRQIPSVKVGGRVLLASSSLQAWLRRRERQEGGF